MSATYYSLEAEMAVTGRILTHGIDALNEIMASGIDFHHFYDERHRTIFRAALDVAAKDQPVDLSTIKAELDTAGKLDTAGGIRYLAGLGDPAGNVDIPHYCAEVIRLAGIRKVLQTAKQIEQAADTGDFDTAISDAQAAIESYSTMGAGKRKSGIIGKVRSLVEGYDSGVFTTQQIYAELGASTPKDKAAVRKALERLKGDMIQATGKHAGQWRVIQNDLVEMDFSAPRLEPLDLWLPLDLHDCAEILPGNIIVITGDADAGKTAFNLTTIQRNIGKWDCHYFNSEMGAEEMRKRLELFRDFPMKHPHFHAYERSCDFDDVIRPERYALNIIDYLEVSDEFYKISGYLNQIHRKLGEAVAIVAIQKKDRGSPMPIGKERALEKPRLAVSLSIGNRSTPNKAEILKCKNRKTEHGMNGMKRDYKLISGTEFRCIGGWE
jgi:hypothetical protein